MAGTTIYKLSEQIMKRLAGGDIPTAISPSWGEVKISIGQVINELLKIDYYQFNAAQNNAERERIPNGTVLAMYEDLPVQSYNRKSIATLPVKPIKLPRNMGVWAVYPKWDCDQNLDFDNEFIPLQMGHAGRLNSQPLISDLLMQVGYEVFGEQIVFTRDLTQIRRSVTVAVRLAIMDISKYDDYTMLPILPEHEAEVVKRVVALYEGMRTADKLTDPAVNQQVGVPITQQKMS